ncbi:hypothetical protein NC651_033582 [Populus alba x Populus x berolinensis]|nr:hypothetical protein NC651_033582 [Populus alba x Populus x berolinensis]
MHWFHCLQARVTKFNFFFPKGIKLY